MDWIWNVLISYLLNTYSVSYKVYVVHIFLLCYNISNRFNILHIFFNCHLNLFYSIKICSFFSFFFLVFTELFYYNLRISVIFGSYSSSFNRNVILERCIPPSSRDQVLIKSCIIASQHLLWFFLSWIRVHPPSF